MVGSQVYEAYVADENPVAFPQVFGDGSPEPSQTSSVMHLVIIAGTTAGGRPIFIDLGQSLEVYAKQITMRLVAPRGSVAWVDTLPAAAAGLLFTSKVGVRALQIEESRSACTAIFTETRYIEPTVPLDVPVPPAARRLTIYPENATSPVMHWLRGNLLLGIVDWDPLRPRQEIDVPSASLLRIGAAVNARTFTLAWTIAP